MLVRRSSWEGDQPQPLPQDMHLASWTDLPSLLPQADLIFLTCSLNDETRGLVDSPFLDKCKPGVRIINVARGGSSQALLLSRHPARHPCCAGNVDWDSRQVLHKCRFQHLACDSLNHPVTIDCKCGCQTVLLGSFHQFIADALQIEAWTALLQGLRSAWASAVSLQQALTGPGLSCLSWSLRPCGNLLHSTSCSGMPQPPS